MEILRLAAGRFLASLGTGGRGMSMSSVTSGLSELFQNRVGPTHHGPIIADRATHSSAPDTRMWISGAALTRVSTATVRELLGDARIRRFASLLHIDNRAALRGLTIALPTVVEEFTPAQGTGRADLTVFSATLV